MKWLNQIDDPSDLRKIDPKHLVEVCEELRQFIVETVSQKGGHFASNLGTVELTVALHYIFETPLDKLIWDVGHQAYGHKILTGRRDEFHSIRQFEGLSGFTCRSESPYDAFGAGHASTSISAALGIAEALKHQGKENFAIAVIGDGSLSGGLAYEALNNAGHIPAKNLLVVFNDNDMSIDPNVGAVNKFMNQAITHPGYNRMRRELKHALDSLQERGIDLTPFASRIRKSVKNFFSPGMLFECFGFRYIGPIDGHNIDELRETFEFIKNEGAKEGPYLVHAITKKGKGYALAEEDSLKYHGVSPFNSAKGIERGPTKKLNYQDVFAEALIELAQEDRRVVAITAAMPSGTGINKFQKVYPERTYDVGIAEPHAVLFAAGLATEGFKPVVAIYSTFLQRAYDQIIHDVALQNLPVVFATDRAGLVGADGATHQGAFDLSYLRCIPNLVIMAPKDEHELRNMLKTCLSYEKGPIAIRYPRGEVVGKTLPLPMMSITIGQAELLTEETLHPDLLLIAVGYSVQECLKAVPLFEQQGLSVAVINGRFVKPIDEKLILKWAQKSQWVVTVEENAKLGGFGSAVLEVFAQHQLVTPVLSIGLSDQFIDHGTPQQQRSLCNVDAQGIFNQVMERCIFVRESSKNMVARRKDAPVATTSRTLQ